MYWAVVRTTSHANGSLAAAAAKTCLGSTRPSAPTCCERTEATGVWRSSRPARSAMAAPAARASKQPRWPQPHRGPSSTSTQCPISPLQTGAVIQVAVDHDARPDAGADGHVDEIAQAAGQVGKHGPQSRRPHVQLQFDVRGQGRLEEFLERQVLPVEVRRRSTTPR